MDRASSAQAEERGRGEERWESWPRAVNDDQAADVVRSLSTPDRVERLTFRASGAAFAALFDGQETLLSITSFPWYVREISVLNRLGG